MRSTTSGSQWPIFTIGHSTRDIGDFLDLLDEHAITMVIDVRKLPGSSRYPQFNADALGLSLSERGIGLTRVEALTGRRKVSASVPFEVNAWWKNRSFHNFADHALSSEFRVALERLQRLGAEQRTAMMCSEAVWWRCHRRIIADHLIAAGTTVVHVLGPGHADDASLSLGAHRSKDGDVTYPG